MKIWVNKSKSFKEAEKFNNDYYFKMSPKKRLENLQVLRELWFNFNKSNNENGKRLRRTIKIIKQK